MFNDNVAQKPTMPVNAGKKKSQKAALFANLEGCCKIGPNPFPSEIAQNNNARAASGRKNALNTSNFLMLSTPRYTTSILSNQNKKKQMAGPVCRPNDAGKICGSLSVTGNHKRSIR